MTWISRTAALWGLHSERFSVQWKVPSRSHLLRFPFNILFYLIAAQSKAPSLFPSLLWLCHACYIKFNHYQLVGLLTVARKLFYWAGFPLQVRLCCPDPSEELNPLVNFPLLEHNHKLRHVCYLKSNQQLLDYKIFTSGE